MVLYITLTGKIRKQCKPQCDLHFRILFWRPSYLSSCDAQMSPHLGGRRVSVFFSFPEEANGCTERRMGVPKAELINGHVERRYRCLSAGPVSSLPILPSPVLAPSTGGSAWTVQGVFFHFQS